MIIFQLILLIFGFYILIKGSDIFIDSASLIAEKFNISKLVIGLTIVSMGTIAPELAVAISAMSTGSGDMIIGNAIGTITFNILVVIGTCAIIRPINVKIATIQKQMPIVVMITSLFIILLMDHVFDPSLINTLSKSDGIAIIIFLMFFVQYLIELLASSKKRHMEDVKLEKPLYKYVLLIIIGLLGIVYGSRLVVDAATYIARTFSVSELIIGQTIIAFGTSLPEFVTAITATIKKEQEIFVGNIVGCCIYNIGLVVAVPVALYGTLVPNDMSLIDIIIFLSAPLLLYLFAMNEKISKKEGITMIILFVIYYIYVIGKGVIL